MTAKPGPRGFTLLETLVALSILGLILAFYGGSLRLMLGALARQGRTTEAASDVETTSAALRRLLEALAPGGPPPVLEAQAHRLHFYTRLPGIEDPVDAVLERDGADRLLLIWSRASHVRLLTAPPRPTATELIDGITGLDFSYWHDGRWSSTLPKGQTPDLVRVRLTRRNASGGADLVVAPRVTPPPAS